MGYDNVIVGRVIQIAIEPASDGHYPVLYAVTDGGRIYQKVLGRTLNDWELVSQEVK